MDTFNESLSVTLELLKSWEVYAAFAGFFLIASLLRYVAVGGRPGRKPFRFRIPFIRGVGKQGSKPAKQQKPKAVEGTGGYKAPEEDEKPGLEEESYPLDEQ